MSTLNPMPQKINDDIGDLDDNTVGIFNLSISAKSKLDLTTEPNEDDLEKQFTREVAKLFDESMKEYRIKSSIGEGGLGKDSDEERRKMVADLKAGLKDEMDNFRKMASECEPASGLSTTQVQALLTTVHKLTEAVLDIIYLDGDPDEKPEIVFETMMRRFLSKEVLQAPLKLFSDQLILFLAKPPASVSDEDIQRYAKQQACLSKTLELFDEVDYRPDHPGYMVKIMELGWELDQYGPAPPSELLRGAFDKFEDQKYRVWNRDISSLAQ